jgi:hypothetical protein
MQKRQMGSHLPSVEMSNARNVTIASEQSTIGATRAYYGLLNEIDQLIA